MLNSGYIDKKHFMKDFGDMCVLASKGLHNQTYE